MYIRVLSQHHGFLSTQIISLTKVWPQRDLHDPKDRADLCLLFLKIQQVRT